MHFYRTLSNQLSNGLLVLAIDAEEYDNKTKKRDVYQTQTHKDRGFV